MGFQKAERKQTKLRMAITGPSGSGKTYSALKIAKGMGKRVAFIDTENRSASLYSDEFLFDTLAIDPPYTVDKYRTAIIEATQSGYEVLVIDTISHAWAGEGGLLDKKGALDMRGGNSYVNWQPITKEHEQFKAMLLNCKIHLIVTMRSKQDYIMEQNSKGKMTPKKVGLAPIQRDGMEYEFTLVLDLAMDHNAQVSKTRIKDLDGKIFTPTEETGEFLLKWLSQGKAAEPAPKPEKKAPEKKAPEKKAPEKKAPEKKAPETNGLISPVHQAELFTVMQGGKVDTGEFKAWMLATFGIDKTADMRGADYPEAMKWIKSKKK